MNNQELAFLWFVAASRGYPAPVSYEGSQTEKHIVYVKPISNFLFKKRNDNNSESESKRISWEKIPNEPESNQLQQCMRFQGARTGKDVYRRVSGRVLPGTCTGAYREGSFRFSVRARDKNHEPREIFRFINRV